LFKEKCSVQDENTPNLIQCFLIHTFLLFMFNGVDVTIEKNWENSTWENSFPFSILWSRLCIAMPCKMHKSISLSPSFFWRGYLFLYFTWNLITWKSIYFQVLQLFFCRESQCIHNYILDIYTSNVKKKALEEDVSYLVYAIFFYGIVCSIIFFRFKVYSIFSKPYIKDSNKYDQHILLF